MTILQYIDELSSRRDNIVEHTLTLLRLRSDFSPSELVVVERLEKECARLLRSNPTISSDELRRHLVDYFAN